MSRLPVGGNGLGSPDAPSREGDDEGEEALLAQLEEAFSGDRGGHEDRAKVLETIQVCYAHGFPPPFARREVRRCVACQVA